jgi:hypothetical protein
MRCRSNLLFDLLSPGLLRFPLSEFTLSEILASLRMTGGAKTFIRMIEKEGLRALAYRNDTRNLLRLGSNSNRHRRR